MCCHTSFFSLCVKLTFLRSVNPMDMVEEGDCFLCYPEDSTINIEPKNTHHRRKRIGEMALGLGGLTAFVVSVLAAVVVICIFLTKRRKVLLERPEKAIIVEFKGRTSISSLYP